MTNTPSGAMKPLASSRTIWISIGQVFLSGIATTLTPGEDCPAWVVKVLTAAAAAAGVAVLLLRADDKRKA